jgi:threonine dehydrogenase-like Zn-dependent dehydrogenase
MVQARFHMRGGQGVVTAAEPLAETAFLEEAPVDAAPTGKRVLVVGAGPSGLPAACHLTRMGPSKTPAPHPASPRRYHG